MVPEKDTKPCLTALSGSVESGVHFWTQHACALGPASSLRISSRLRGFPCVKTRGISSMRPTGPAWEGLSRALSGSSWHAGPRGVLVPVSAPDPESPLRGGWQGPGWAGALLLERAWQNSAGRGHRLWAAPTGVLTPAQNLETLAEQVT